MARRKSFKRQMAEYCREVHQEALRAETRNCRACKKPKQILICGDGHAFVWCLCRDKICPVCHDFEQVREPRPYFAQAEKKEKRKEEADYLAALEDALKTRPVIPFNREEEC